jgi:ATP-grasp ribosomal peptide maturase
MNREPVILVLTHPFDPTADFVVAELNRRGVPLFRCDPGEFPQRLTLTATLDAGWVGSLLLPERGVALEDFGCAYYRRPTLFELPDDLDPQVTKWASDEARMGLGGVLSALPRWLNHPADISRAEYKPVQLSTARRCGLDVPRTLVTNDPKAAVDFGHQVGRVVYKPLTPSQIVDDGEVRIVYTTPVDVVQLADESISLTAHLLQEWVDKAYEVRLTVADNAMFAARIDAHTPAAEIDWRSDYGKLTYSMLPDIPRSVRRGVTLLLRSLHLRFGALDFIVTPDGQWVFLEVNPNGQWAWIEEATGAPIAAAIADALQREVPL